MLLNFKSEKSYQSTNEIIKKHNIVSNSSTTNELLEDEINFNEWKLEIPKINLVANISEGTSKEILNNYIGHFEETKKDIGNIGLAAHNRGYQVIYFEKLKDLKEGDYIYYTYKETKRTYVIISRLIIKDTEWSNLENTEDNRLTLITCVENKPKLRRCVQAIEVK